MSREEPVEPEDRGSDKRPFIGWNLSPGFLSALGALAKIGVIVAGVTSIMWFVFDRYDSLKEKLHEQDLAVKALSSALDLKVGLLAKDVEAVNSKAKTESTESECRGLVESVFDKFCADFGGRYNYQTQYCYAGDKKVLYRPELYTR